MRLIGIILGLLLIIVVTSCVPAEKRCSIDSDCVENSCCHSTYAVNKEHAPKCGIMICTQECMPGTTDCGQAEVKCVSRECMVVKK